MGRNETNSQDYGEGWSQASISIAVLESKQEGEGLSLRTKAHASLYTCLFIYMFVFQHIGRVHLWQRFEDKLVRATFCFFTSLLEYNCFTMLC